MPQLTNIFYLVACIALSWLFFDSLKARFDIKTLLKAFGFTLLALGVLFNITSAPDIEDSALVIFLSSVAFYFFYLGFVLDQRSKFGFGVVGLILSQFFLQAHALLSFQAGLVALVVLQLAYTTYHRDLMPLGIGFVLIAVAEFLKAQGKNFAESGLNVYLFVSLFFLIWLWQYVSPRLKFLKRKRGAIPKAEVFSQLSRPRHQEKFPS